MPRPHPTRNDTATTLLQRIYQNTRKRGSSNPLHVMDVHAVKGTSLRDELRLHARYIRDTLAPILSRQSMLTHSDVSLLRSILKRLDSMPMTLDRLRYSRMEKALMVIVASGASAWPLEAVVRAEELMQKWEEQLGPLKNLRSDLYGPGGSLEGVKKIAEHKKGEPVDKDDEAKSAWAVHTLNPLHSYRYGSLGFEVGDWWLKPAAAYRDGIIDKTSHAITADANGAYAILLAGNRELDLKANGRFAYHAALDDPGALKLSKTMLGSTEKIVRVLRSWKLRSPLAPKAGLRYDGLYRIESFGIKLVPPNSWHKTFTLSRLGSQPPMTTALAYPMSDQLDDWRDYQRLKNVDHGDDFSILREMLRDPSTPSSSGIEAGGEGMEKGDSGYFSRRSSKISSRLNSIPEAEELDGLTTFVAEVSPSISDSESYESYLLAAPSTAVGAHQFFDPNKAESTVDSAGHNFDPDLRHMDRVILNQSPAATAEILRYGDSKGIHRPENPHDWAYEWRNRGSVLDGVEEDALDHWTARSSGIYEDEEVDPTDDGTVEDAVPPSRSNEDQWIREGGIWRSENGGLDGVEEEDFAQWASTTQRETEVERTQDSNRTTDDSKKPGVDSSSDEENDDTARVSQTDKRDWTYEDGIWRSEESGLEGVEKADFVEWESRMSRASYETGNARIDNKTQTVDLTETKDPHGENLSTSQGADATGELGQAARQCTYQNRGVFEEVFAG